MTGLGRARKSSPHRKDSCMYLFKKMVPTPRILHEARSDRVPEFGMALAHHVFTHLSSMVWGLDRQSTPAEHAPWRGSGRANQCAPFKLFWRILLEFPRILENSPSIPQDVSLRENCAHAPDPPRTGLLINLISIYF